MIKKFITLIFVMIFTLVTAIELNGARFPQNRLTIVSPWWEGEASDELAEHFSEKLANQLRIPVGIKNLYKDKGVTAKLDTFLYSPVTRLKLLLYDNWIPILEGQPNLSDFMPIGSLAIIPYVFVAQKKNAVQIQSNFESVMRAEDTKIVLYSWDKYADTIIEKLKINFKKNFRIVRVNDIRGPIRELEKNSDSIVLTTLSTALNVYPRDISQAIAVLSNTPVEWLPDLPTGKDVGLHLDAARIFALLAPKNIPTGLFKEVEDVVKYVTKSEDYFRFTKSRKMIPYYLPPEETTSRIQRESIDYCKKCNCSDKNCKKNCGKCSR